MPNPIKPADRGIPQSPLAKWVPLANRYLEDGSVPIFWGDNQKIDEGNLTWGRPSGMKGSPLHIPKVVRFLYTFDESKDMEDKYKDAYTGDTPPTPEIELRGIIDWWGLRPTLVPSWRSDNIYLQAYPYGIKDGFYDVVQSDLDLGAGPGWHDTAYSASQFYGSIWGYGMTDSPNFRIQIRPVGGGTPLYTGPISGATTYFEFPVYRSVRWFQRVDGGTETFLFGVGSLSPDGTNPTQPPRCKYQPYSDGVHTPAMESEHPLYYYLQIYGDYGPCEGNTP